MMFRSALYLFLCFHYSKTRVVIESVNPGLPEHKGHGRSGGLYIKLSTSTTLHQVYSKCCSADTCNEVVDELYLTNCPEDSEDESECVDYWAKKFPYNNGEFKCPSDRSHTLYIAVYILASNNNTCYLYSIKDADKQEENMIEFDEDGNVDMSQKGGVELRCRGYTISDSIGCGNATSYTCDLSLDWSVREGYIENMDEEPSRKIPQTKQWEKILHELNYSKSILQ